MTKHVIRNVETIVAYDEKTGTHAYLPDADIAFDNTELEDCRWFTREEIGAALHRDGSEPDGGDPGAISLAPAISIARSLIRDWYRHGPMLTPA